ncbi:Serine/threonine-protein kinase 40 [Orchesella cincta]|uniref:Serine/threonine-protein kinase 40 n=1 Tax=Orchesella cincta TaxID=48709 RepID=A0A1D2MAY9_ORCCI|nr:Serine/threonine-protein kinase 40 [Orchesella cincta]
MKTPSTKKIIIEKEPIAFSSSSWEKSQHSTKRAGEYLLGPKQGSSPVKCIQQYLARKDGTDEFYIIKMLTMKGASEKETMDDIQGKTLLHTEHSLSSLLKYEDGVVHEHGMFRSTIDETHCNDKGEIVTKEVTKLCLVLDCYMPHDFSPKYSHITNMQYYLICLGKHLTSDNDLLKDQRGSPAYISPDVIIGKPYLGKPSDMWALGVVLYTMVYGQFPFYDQSPTGLFRKIKTGEFQIPVYHTHILTFPKTGFS